MNASPMNRALAALLGVALCFGVCRVGTAQSRRTAGPRRYVAPAGLQEPAPLHFADLSQPAQAEDLPAPAKAQRVRAATGLSLAEIESIAVANSPALAEASAKMAAAQGRWTQVGLYPNPAIGYSGQQLNSGGQAEQNGVLVEQEFVTAGKLRKAREAAGWEVNRIEQELAAMRLRVLTDVRISFYEAIFAQRRQAVARDLVGINERVLASAEQLFDAGEVGKPDVLRAKIELNSGLIDQRRADNQFDAAWRRLTAAAGAPTMPRAPLLGEPEDARREIVWEDAIQSVLTQSPELAAAQASVQQAAWSLQLERAKFYPNVTVQGVVQYDESIERTNGNLQASLPIPLFDRNQGAIREARAELVAAQAAVDRTALRLQRELGRVFERYANAHFQVEKYAAEMLPNARSTLDLVRQGYEAGEIAFIDLLNAEQTLAEVYLAYIDSLREEWTATAEIDGLLLSGSLGDAGR
jgi:cobalt-zinc-cadmium efflux system outer membrane protein